MDFSELKVNDPNNIKRNNLQSIYEEDILSWNSIYNTQGNLNSPILVSILIDEENEKDNKAKAPNEDPPKTMNFRIMEFRYLSFVRFRTLTIQMQSNSARANKTTTTATNVIWSIFWNVFMMLLA